MRADSKEAASDCRFGGLHSLGGGLWGRYLWPTLCILRNQRLAPRQTVGELVGAAGDVEMLKTLGRCLKVVVSHRCHGSGPCLRGKSSTWTRWMQNKNPLISAGSWWLDMCSFGAVSQLTLLFKKNGLVDSISRTNEKTVDHGAVLNQGAHSPPISASQVW